MAIVTIGVDIGQRIDPTAVCVAERELRPRPGDGRRESHFTVRHLESLPLGTPYPAVAARVAAIAARVAERGGYPTLYVDSTGVGLPVVDSIRDARPKAAVVAVTFTHGDARTVLRDARGRVESVKLGKAHLVSQLQVLLQGARLHLPRTAAAELLAKELLEFEIRVDQDANDKYGAFKVGTHDDLVTALGLACQADPLPPASAFGNAVTKPGGWGTRRW